MDLNPVIYQKLTVVSVYQ